MTSATPQVPITLNPFARSLLNYSADRDDCIGRPDRWGTPPPLMVDGTQLHLEMSDLADEIWSAPAEPIWYFLVGGPGNGKSEAVGALVRRLDHLRGSTAGPMLANAASVSGTGRIRYAYDCTPKPGVSLVLVQDISVPKTAGSLPELDLLNELMQAFAKGSHAVICANRGMLLRAVRAARADAQFACLVRELEQIDKNSQEAELQATSRWRFLEGDRAANIRVWPLDHESVMLGQGQDGWRNPTGSLLDQIVTKAIADENWEANGCAQCAMRELCPIYNDAVWLRDPAKRQGFLRTLRHAEVLSGQRIVLREALGMLAMVLVGAPSDFIEDGKPALHPCEWVHRLGMPGQNAIPPIANVLELISHRIYMDLFCRQRPAGLAVAGTAQAGSDDWILTVLAKATPLAMEAASAARHLDKHFAKQAGPVRFSSAASIFGRLDPASDCSWCHHDQLDPDLPVPAIAAVAAAKATKLEEALLAHYDRIEASIKGQQQHADVARQLAALSRWFSGFYLWMKGTADGSCSLAIALDDYLLLLSQPTAQLSSTGGTKNLSDLLRDSVKEYRLTQDYVAEMVPPRPQPTGARPRSVTPRWPASDRFALELSSTVSVALSAATFVDIWQRRHNKVARWCMPPSLENLTNAWRDESVVLEQKYRNLPAVIFKGTPSLEFEVGAGDMIHVRKA